MQMGDPYTKVFHGLSSNWEVLGVSEFQAE
jgi:hypothetical protein